MYSQRITSNNPSALIFMVDQSRSMEDKITIQNHLIASKGQWVTQALNSAISEIINRCKTLEDITDYFRIAVIGYGDYGVKSLLHPQKDFLTCSDIYRQDCPVITSEILRQLPNGLIKSFSLQEYQWVKPYYGGKTPMGAALDYVIKMIAKEVQTHPTSFPPMVFNLTDGEHSDCDYQQIIEKTNELKSLSTSDGNVILINTHICNNDLKPDYKSLFPSSKEEIGQSSYARLLYDTSSTLPKIFNPQIAEIKAISNNNNNYKAMSHNASINELFCMINIGSTTLSLI